MEYITNQAKFLPFPSSSPHPDFERPNYSVLCILEAFFMWLTVLKDRLKMYLPKNVILLKESE